jgi:hypothetical protein
MLLLFALVWLRVRASRSPAMFLAPDVREFTIE